MYFQTLMHSNEIKAPRVLMPQCMHGGTEAVQHEATYISLLIALLGRSSSRSLHCAKVENDRP